MNFTDRAFGTASSSDTDTTTAPPPPRRRRDGMRRFEALLELAPDATVVVDARGCIRLLNHQTEQLFGYPAEELLGQPVELLVPERLRGMHQKHLAGDGATAPHVRPFGANLPLSGRRRDGSEFPIKASLGPLGEGSESLVIVSIHDISELQWVHDAHVATQAANQDLHALQALTDTALSHLSLDDLLPALLERIADVLTVDNAAVFLLDLPGEVLTVRAAHERGESTSAEVCLPVGQGIAGHVAATREPLVVDDITIFPLAIPSYRDLFHSVACVPLEVGKQLLGVVLVATVSPRQFTTRDVQLLRQAADRIALAIDRARLYTGEQEARAQAEAALAQAQISQHRYQRLVEANIIGVAVTDTECVLEANDAFLRLVGYTQSDVQAGRLYRDVVTMPDTRALAARTAQEAVTNGASMPFEREYVRKDGSRVPVLVAPVLLQRDPLRLVNFVVDLSERKQLEQALAERVTQLEAVMEAVPYPLAVYDPTGRVTLANAVYQENVPPGETVADRIQHIGGVFNEQGEPLEAADWPQSRALRGEILAGTRAVELALHTPQGEPVYSRVTAAPLRNQAGDIVGAVTLNQAMTEFKRLEREREEAHARELAAEEVTRQLKAFLAMAAHDMRTPVTIISGQVQLALRRAQRLTVALTSAEPPMQAADAVAESLDIAWTGVKRLRRLVEHLFDVTQAQTGTLALKLALCDLKAVVCGQVAAQQVLMPGRHIVLEVPPDEVAVEADADRLDQVLSNYLTNALKYSPAHQPVTARLEVVGNLAVVSIVDHGPGLPLEEQSRVWELFHRVPGIEVQHENGEASGSLGLGLHICKRLVELHQGGSVGVGSVVGAGSTFWFQLPLAGT